MTEQPISSRARVLPLAVLLGALLIWTGLSLLKVFPESVFPSPLSVAKGFVEEARSGRLSDDLVASLFRVTPGFAVAVFAGIPVGLWLGQHAARPHGVLDRDQFFPESFTVGVDTSPFCGLASVICRRSS